MQHHEGTFTNNRNARIYHQSWLPEGEARAVILIVHGLAEHGGRYANVVNHLVPQGYAIYALDHIGHGRSDGTRVYVDSFAEYITTLKTYFDMVRAEQPGKPIFLYGHSLGGLITANYLLEHQSGLAGAILSGALVTIPRNLSPATVLAARIVARILPKMGVNVLDSSGISHDPAVVKAYDNDPLVYRGRITARLGAEMFAAVRRAQAGMDTITLPVFILHGGADPLVDPASATYLNEHLGSADKTLKIYPDLYHELHNELQHPQVLADVQAWLEKRLA